MKKVVILGGGVLGTQIGLMCAYYGYDTYFWLRNNDSVDRTKIKIKKYKNLIFNDLKNYKVNHKKNCVCPNGLIKNIKNFSIDEIDELIKKATISFDNLINLDTNLEIIKNAYIVIEALPENIDIKIEIYKKINGLLNDDTILLTNTSTLTPSMFKKYIKYYNKFLALHFANRIWRFNTAEVMGHCDTCKLAYRDTVDFAKSIGMIPIELKNEQPGYVLNSMLIPFLFKALELLINCISTVEQIDKTWIIAMGSPNGPFQIMDIIGIDTMYNISLMDKKSKIEGTVENKINKLLKEKLDRGELGINSKKGFYDYT